MKKKIIVFWIFINIIICTSAMGHEISNIKGKVQAQQIPKFCLCAGYPPPACSSNYRNKYNKLYGPIFGHIHHFCWGLDKLNTALSIRDKGQREFLLNNVISEYDYVLRKKDPKKKMKHIVFIEKAKVLMLLGKKAEAVRNYYNAIQFKPNYVRAYIYLGDYFISNGHKKEALKIIKNGLKYSPNSLMLKNKLKQLEAVK